MLYPLPKLERVEINGIRYYLTPEGKHYPSVTTITSQYNKDSINKWRESVGNDVADRISKQATNRGTRFHSLCESYLMGESVKPSIFDQENWLKFQPILENITDVQAIEAGLYSDYLEVAGTVDCIAKWNNRISVIDFKTSKRIKKKEEIANYFMQCSAYAIAWEERTKIPICNLVVLISVDEEEPQVIIGKRDDYCKQFIALRKKFCK